MKHSVECPSCRARLKVPVAAAGKRIACPRCKQEMVLPGAVTAQPPAPPPMAPPPVPGAYAPPQVAQQFAPPPPVPPRPTSDNPFALDDPGPGVYADEGPMLNPPSIGRGRSGGGGGGAGVALGLGIASLVVGVIGVVMVVALSCLAWLAIPIGVLGLLLGIAAVIMAIVAGRAYLFPILGTAVCAGCIVLAYFWPYLVVRSAVRDVEDKLRDLHKGGLPPGFEKPFDLKQPPF